MSEKDKIREELESLSPRLLKMKESGRPAFRVPEGYFGELPGDVLRRIRAEEGLTGREQPAAPSGLPWRVWLQGLLRSRYAAGMAMAAVLLALGVYWFWPQAAAAGPEEALAGVSEAEAAAYITENIGEFELELMLEASMVDAEDMPAVEVLPDIREEDIDRYLDEFIEDIGLDELEEML